MASSAKTWPTLAAVYAEVHRAATLLANHEEQPSAALAADYHYAVILAPASAA